MILMALYDLLIYDINGIMWLADLTLMTLYYWLIYDINGIVWLADLWY